MGFKWWRVLAAILVVLHRITPWEFVRVIMDRECTSEYLIRHYVFSTRWLMDPLAKHVHPWFAKLSYRITLHRTLRSDDDGQHNHPWIMWGSRILEGCYVEYTPDGAFVRDPSQGWRWRGANDYHRLVLDQSLLKEGEEVWSLFVMGERTQDWGFLDKDGNHVQWAEYIRNRHLYI